MSARAIEVLRRAALIAAEDTRHSRKLLGHYAISTPMVSLHEHNELAQTGRLIERLLDGASIAVIADAGTPLISDPGYRLVVAAHAAGIQVSPVPGPSAIVAALSVAGLPTDRFVFEGFLPARPGLRQHRLTALAQEPRTLAFYEASHRIYESLCDMQAILGPDRQGVVARELTKLHEQVIRGGLAQLAEYFADAARRRGEFVVLIKGAPEMRSSAADDAARVLAVLLAEMPLKTAVKLASRITGEPKNRLYERALKHMDALS